jgi:hypothetical protein
LLYYKCAGRAVRSFGVWHNVLEEISSSFFRAEVRRLLEVLLVHPKDLTVDQTSVKTSELKQGEGWMKECECIPLPVIKMLD